MTSMTKWIVLFRKEWLELIRSYRIVWLPISFILLGASQPVATYFMADILSGAGNLPEGAVIQIPTPHAYEVMASALQQYGVIGLLLVALSSMSTVSGERSSGTAAMILVKPVSFASFITAKWAAILALSGASLAVGYGAAWYYTTALFAPVGWRQVLPSLLLYALWVGFVGTLALMFSSLLRSAAAAAFGALATAALLSIAFSALPYEQNWNPAGLPRLAGEFLNPDGSSSGVAVLGVTVAVTAAAIAAALFAATRALRSKPSE